MKSLVAMTALMALIAAAASGASFDEDFTGSTMRIDFYHTGTSADEHFAPDRIRVEGPWPGSRTQLIDTVNLGAYYVEVADLATNQLLYTRGFSSIFGEWQETREAANGVWRCFPEAVRVPEPRRPFQLRIRKRGPDQSLHEVWAITIDPASRFVDRAWTPSSNVWTVMEHGDPSVKVDLLILGDGYAASEMERFQTDVKKVVNGLFKVEPFASHRNDFNVRAVGSPAARSGVTRPRDGVFRETPLGARYNSLDSERYLLTLDDRAWRDIAAAAPYDAVVILANERKYGGGGIYNLYATAAAHSGFAEYLVIHEFGHHFAGLGDEYYTSDVAYIESPGPVLEPRSPNVTALNDPDKLKWADLIQPGTPLPTPWNSTEYDTKSRQFQERRRALRRQGASEDEVEALFREEQALFTKTLSEEPHAGKVGAFEGAMYRAKGLYRPTTDCLMFTRDDVGFCPVCRRAIERAIQAHTR